MASTFISQGKEEHVRICIAREHLVPPGQPFYCLSAEGLLNTHCCYEDYCNSVDLKAPGESSPPRPPPALRTGLSAPFTSLRSTCFPLNSSSFTLYL